MAGMPPRYQHVSLADFIAEVALSGLFEAELKECPFSVSKVDPTLALEVDRDLLLSAVGNLLQNAFKYTRNHGEVMLNAYAAADRIRIDVEDRCGGLPDGAAARMFEPFTQFDSDKSGLGLGLSICQRSVEANLGVLTVRNLPGTGCIFSIDLPRHAMAA
jgi:signal transduction histidine kinase